MLPITSDNGSRLAAILPTCLASLASVQQFSGEHVLADALGVHEHAFTEQLTQLIAELPQVRSVVVVVVDGLGFANLKARSAHARTLTALLPKRIETVVPSTTGAALTTLTTSRLPGVHGLLGYQIRHPEVGLVSTLKGWESINDTATWQRATPIFQQAKRLGVRSVAIGRPAHAESGLTQSILAGAEYLSGQTIVDRFAIASQLVRGNEPVFAYLYVDELDKVAHSSGWQSQAWSDRLELLDSTLSSFLDTVPSDVGVAITADHGIVDVPEHKQVIIDSDVQLCEGLLMIGGEPRLRSLYLDPQFAKDQQLGDAPLTELAKEIAQKFQAYLGKRAWVGTREEAIDAGWFGSMDHRNVERLGEVIIAARGQFAFYSQKDSAASRAMVGQHGSLSDEERGVPLVLAGAFSQSVLGAVITQVAKRGA